MSLRTDRVASLIKEEVGMFLTREYRDPSYGFITVMDVQMTPDLRIAKIYVSILGDEKKRTATFEMLEEQKSQIRSFIGSVIRLKFTPAIQIYLDDTLDRVDKINKLIKQAHANDDSHS